MAHSALIIGSGIGGLASAIAIRSIGIDAHSRFCTLQDWSLGRYRGLYARFSLSRFAPPEFQTSC